MSSEMLAAWLYGFVLLISSRVSQIANASPNCVITTTEAANMPTALAKACSTQSKGLVLGASSRNSPSVARSSQKDAQVWIEKCTRFAESFCSSLYSVISQAFHFSAAVLGLLDGNALGAMAALR